MVDPVEILYIDDDLSDYQRIQTVLAKAEADFRVTTAPSRQEGERLLAAQPYDLVLADLSRPNEEGRPLLEAIRAVEPDLPLIIVTDGNSEEAALEAVQQGAVDYVIKSPERLKRLSLAIHHALETKRWQQERRQRKRQLSDQAQIFHTIQEAVEITDLEGRLIYRNPAAEAIAGALETERLDQTSLFLALAQNSAQPAIDREAILAGQTYQADRQIRGPDGSARWVAARISLRRDAGGEASGFITVLQEITGRKQLEAELRASQERQGRVAKAGKVGVWEWDLDTNEMYIDPYLKRMLGFEDHQIEDHLNDWGQRVHPDDAAEVMAAAQAHIEGETTWYEVQHRMLHKDGSVRWVLARGVARRNREGKAHRLVGTDTDVTERRAAEQKLRESQAQLELAIQAAQLGFWDWNIQTNTVYYSPEWKRQLGYTARELSKDFTEFKQRIHPADRERVLTSLYDYLETPWPDYQTEARFRHKDGSYRWMLVRATLLIGASGQSYRLLGSNIDITERKQVEEELKRRNQFIEIILDNLPIGLAVNYIDEGAATYMNAKFEEIYGWPRQELTDIENFFNCVYPDPDYRKQIQTQILADLQTGEPERMSWEGVQITTQTGRKKIVAAKNIPLYEQNLMISTVQDITERKQAEEALRASEENLRITLNSIGDAVIATDLNGNVVRMNPVAETLTGWRLAEAKNKPLPQVFNIVDAQTGKKMTNPVSRVIEHDEIVGLANHTMLNAKDGRQYQIADSAAPIRAEDGKITGVVLVFRDVTEEYRMRQQIIASETLFRAMTEQSGEGISLANATGNYVMVNPAFCQMTGYSQGELLTMTVRDLIPPESELSLFCRVINRQSGRREMELVKKDGSRFMAEISGYPVELDNQRMVLGIVRDITAKKEAERRQKNLLDRLALAIKTAKLGVWTLDIASGHLHWNDHLLEIYGLTRQEFEEDLEGWRSQVHPDDADYANAELAKVFEGEEVYDVVFRVIRPSGEVRTVNSSARPVYNQDQEIVKLVGINFDITGLNQVDSN